MLPQTCTLSKDRSFTFAIDALDSDETGDSLEAATALARQIREVVISSLVGATVAHGWATMKPNFSGSLEAGIFITVRPSRLAITPRFSGSSHGTGKADQGSGDPGSRHLCLWEYVQAGGNKTNSKSIDQNRNL